MFDPELIGSKDCLFQRLSSLELKKLEQQAEYNKGLVYNFSGSQIEVGVLVAIAINEAGCKNANLSPAIPMIILRR